MARLISFLAASVLAATLAESVADTGPSSGDAAEGDTGDSGDRERLLCPMPVIGSRDEGGPMPIVRPNSGTHYTILAAPVRCENPLAAVPSDTRSPGTPSRRENAPIEPLDQPIEPLDPPAP